jgi:hypothetical protein
MTTFRVETIARPADGPITPPKDTPNVAYWVEGTNSNHVFLLSPTPNNQALSASLKSGDEAHIVWADCTSSSYTLLPFEQLPSNVSTILDQSVPGISVLVPAAPSTPGFVVKGGQWEVQLAADDPSIDGGVTLLEATASSDGKTVRVGIAITNYGSDAFSVSVENISLMSEGAAPIALLSAEPTLPRKINPGAREVFYLTFPQASSRTVTLRIFNADIILKNP